MTSSEKEGLRSAAGRAGCFGKDFDALELGERFVTRGRTIGEADITSTRTANPS